jgi:hypothetical protein
MNLVKKTYLTGSALLLLGFFSRGTYANSPYVETTILARFKSYKEYHAGATLLVPTVVEIPFESDSLENTSFAVRNVTNGYYAQEEFLPYYFSNKRTNKKAPMDIGTLPYNAQSSYMLDGNTQTYVAFELSDNTPGEVLIQLTSMAPITSDTLTLSFDNYVTMPTAIEITSLKNSHLGTVVAKKDFAKATINFPETTSSFWEITLTHTQPLRISEINLVQKNPATIATQSLRFLAHPQNSYIIYFNPDRAVSVPTSEEGNLYNNEDVINVGPLKTMRNLSYKVSDKDFDGIPDMQDNCNSIPNADQQDINRNGIGDVCDDYDKDGILNAEDNCPNSPNVRQRDTDGDGIGDVCDNEESRLTEKHTWLPWLGIGFAAIVLTTLLAIAAKSMRSQEEGQTNDAADDDD